MLNAQVINYKRKQLGLLYTAGTCQNNFFFFPTPENVYIENQYHLMAVAGAITFGDVNESNVGAKPSGSEAHEMRAGIGGSDLKGVVPLIGDLHSRGWLPAG